jgi:hypothetical protein
MYRLKVKQGAHRALLVLTVVLLVHMPAKAAVLPGEPIDEALMDVDEDLQLVIKNHIESQLDWRSYYLDRRETWRPIPPPSSLRSQKPLSLDDRDPGAGVPVCLGNTPSPLREKDADAKCRRDFSPT